MAAKGKKKIVLDEIGLKALFRFEDGRGLLNCDAKDVKSALSHPAEIRFEDIKKAVENIKVSKLNRDKIYDAWFYWLNFEFSILDNSFFIVKEDDSTDINGIFSDYEQFEIIWSDINLMLLNDSIELTWDEILSDIDRAIRNRGKSALDREITPAEQEDYIRYYDSENALNKANEKELFLFRTFVEKGIKSKRKAALYAAAYGCYGGNRAFECDWKRSEQLLLTLIEQGDENPSIANTLGYIYYYGRTTDKVPQYDKAFKYFSVGAAGGVYESKYKLADMFRHGYGVAKNKLIETQIVNELYEDNLRYISNGVFDCKFADIALRKSSLLFDTRAENQNTDNVYDAYYCCLQADFAIRRRMECSNYYGDSKVSDGIQEGLKVLKELFPEFREGRTVPVTNPENLFHDSLASGHRIEMKIKPLANGAYSLTFRALQQGDEDCAPKLFVTIPERSFCGMLPAVKIRIRPSGSSQFFGLSETVVFDSVSYSSLIEYGRVVADLSGKLTMSLPAPDEIKSCTIAAVSYNGSDQLYDFICEADDIKEGDFVLVGSEKDPVKVQVIKISEKKETELALPLKAYKKVLRKL